MNPYVISKNLLKPIDHDFRSILKRSKVSTFFCFYFINFQAMTLQQYLYCMAYTLQPFPSLYSHYTFMKSALNSYLRAVTAYNRIVYFPCEFLHFYGSQSFSLITLTRMVRHTLFFYSNCFREYLFSCRVFAQDTENSNKRNLYHRSTLLKYFS